MQIIEDVNIEGGDFILSWTGTAQGRVNSGTYAASPVRVTGLPAGTAVTVEFSMGTVKDVQFESGTTPTPFERRFYGAELAMCQRYFWKLQQIIELGVPQAGDRVCNLVALPVEMRVNPTVENVTYWASAGSAGTHTLIFLTKDMFVRK